MALKRKKNLMLLILYELDLAKQNTYSVFLSCLLQRRFPDFSYITQNGRLTDFLDCVIIRFVC